MHRQANVEVDLSPFKNEVFQFSQEIFPEIQDLTEHFNKNFSILADFSLSQILEENPFRTKLYEECFHQPNKDFYEHYEQNSWNPKTGPGKEKNRLIFEVKQHLVNYFENNSYGDEAKDWKAKAGYIKKSNLWTFYRSQKDSFDRKFGVTVSGLFYYPPGGFREWHTNNDRNGWRMYFIRVSQEGRSWFHYLHPLSDQLIKIPDKDACFNLFYVTSIDEVLKGRRFNYLWHNVVSQTHRRSLGFYVPEGIARRLLKRMGKIS